MNPRDVKALMEIHDYWGRPSGPMPPNCLSWRGSVQCTKLGDVIGINLAQANLTGTIPEAMGDLSDLQELFLGFNEGLYGGIPQSLNQTRITYLDLFQTGLNSTFPEWIGELTYLKRLDLSQTYIQGTIPESIGELKNLEQLFLINNELEGSIPASLSQLSNLQQIDVTNSGFNGAIPDLSQSRGLWELKMGNNSLTGTIPTAIGQLNNLTTVNFESNQLTGPIPDISNMSALRTFNVDNNQLTGTFPASLLNLMPHVSIFWAANNALTGTVPNWVCTWGANFLNFDLRNNNFDCPLPQCCSGTGGRCLPCH